MGVPVAWRWASLSVERLLSTYPLKALLQWVMANNDGPNDYRSEWVCTNTYATTQPWVPTFVDVVQSAVPPPYDPRPLDAAKRQLLEPIGQISAMTYDASAKAISSAPEVSSKPVTYNQEALRLQTYDSVGPIRAMTYDSSGRGIVSTPVEIQKVAYSTEGRPSNSYEPKGQICAMTYDSSGLGIVMIKHEGSDSK